MQMSLDSSFKYFLYIFALEIIYLTTGTGVIPNYLLVIAQTCQQRNNIIYNYGGGYWLDGFSMVVRVVHKGVFGLEWNQSLCKAAPLTHVGLCYLQNIYNKIANKWNI